MRNFVKKKSFINASASILSILIGFGFGFLVLLVSNAPYSFVGLYTILLGGFNGGMQGIGNVLYIAAPVIMTGLSVGFAFRTGLFNIGATGQFIVGAFASVYIGVKWTFIPPDFLWMVALIAGLLAGALWAFIPGILKAYRNVNEVISSIIMNYIGLYLVNFLIVQTIFDSAKNQALKPVNAVLPVMGLDMIFPFSSINIGFFVAVLFAVLAYIILFKTTFGFELKACGFNRHAAEYAGIDAKRNIWMSMVIAGAFAGLGGGIMYLAGTGKHFEVIDLLLQYPEGFTGISVALLGLSNPLGIIFAGIFIGYIKIGGFYIQRYPIMPEIIDLMVAVIIYLSALSLFFREKIVWFITKLGAKS
jgi:general nucleoside transport system permease protein